MNLKPEASIIVEGQEVIAPMARIVNLTTSQEVNKISRAKIVIKEGSSGCNDFFESNKHQYKPGKDITILLGTVNEKNIVFEGVIIKQSLKIKKGRPSILEVECRDKAIKLSIDRKKRSFKEKTDSVIFKEILDDYDDVVLEMSETSDVEKGQLVQEQNTDWDFIAMRAEATACYIFNRNNKIIIKKPDLSATPIRTLEYKRQGDPKTHSVIWDFEQSLDARQQFKQVKISSWNSADQTIVEEEADFLSKNEQGNVPTKDLEGVLNNGVLVLQHLGRVVGKELIQLADAIKQKQSLNKIKGRVKIEGVADVQIGDLVKLAGVGERFIGNAFVSKVHHSFGTGRWFTEFILGLPNEWFHQKKDIQKPPALGRGPTISGLQIGKVVSLEKEGEPGNSSVKVSIPGMEKGDKDGIWARMASLHAGADRGAQFFPELEDEVVLGYIDQDASEPVILGVLYSENNKPPFPLKDDNFIKGLTTKKGSKLIFDDEKGDIIIETANGHQLVLNDGEGKIEIKDSNNNSIEMSASGIVFNSNTNIELSATGNIDIKATGITTIDGSQINLGATAARSVAALGDPVAALAGAGTIGPALPNAKVKI